MKIECIKEKLGKLISLADRISGKNLTLPVLSCVYLEAKKGLLKIKATNLDLGLELDMPVKVDKEGEVAVPGNILNSFLSNIRDDKNVSLEVKDGNLTVSSSKASANIKAIPHDDFPLLPKIESERKVKIDASDFSKGLKAVWYSSGTSSMKPELSSVYVYGDESGMIFAATDSFRLAEKRVNSKSAADMKSVLIPFKNVAEIMRILGEFSGDMDVLMDKNQISFSNEGVYLVSRVVDGVFPDYRQIIPKSSSTDAIALKEDLINTLKIATIFSDAFNKVSLRVLPSSKVFEIKTRNNDVGETVNKIDAALTGEDIESNFNHKYITDCFQSIESDSVSLSFNGTNRPLIIKGVSDQSFMYLVMPMNK